MPRKKEFDEFEVLNRAMEIFWHKGYEATSVQDLVETMGINRGSLYGTFSDKRALFLATIQHYDRTVVSAIVQVLHRPGSARQAIEEYFADVVERCARDLDREGCFLAHSAVEVAPHDPEVEKRLQALLQRIESAFYDALVLARKQGEISTQRNLRDVARFLTSNLQGIRVMARVNSNREHLLTIADMALAILDD